MLAIEPSVARPKTAVKRREGGHTTHEVSHCLLVFILYSGVSNVTERKHSADITSRDTCTYAAIDTAMLAVVKVR